MRALLITPVLPSATGNGLSMRAGVWLEALSRRFDTDVAVAALFPPSASASGFTASLAQSTTMLSGQLGQLPGLPRTVPTLDEQSTQRLHELVLRADIVVVFRLYLAGLAEQAHARGIPVVVDVDDLDWVREERLGEHDEADAYRRYAASVLGVATVATTASAADTSIGSEMHAGPRWLHVPNGVRTPARDARAHAEPDVDLLFVATLGYAPNADAARWLVQDVLPRLPGATAAIVGAAPPPAILALASQRVTIAADVPDVTPWYQRARVCVVPIHAGSGTRTKIPEAWAHRRPVVSTTIGAEGIDVRGAALIADDADSFAHACARMLYDASTAQQLTDTGWDRYAALHTFERACAGADDAVDAALTSAGRTPPARRITT